MESDKTITVSYTEKYPPGFLERIKGIWNGILDSQKALQTKGKKMGKVMRQKQLSSTSKLNTPAFVQMREVASGAAMRKEIRDTLFRAETMRNDAALNTAAEVKRQKRMVRNQALQQNVKSK